MKTVDKLMVFLDGERVGTLVPYQRYLTAFEYEEGWLNRGFSISPFSLPLEPGVHIARMDPFDGLFGIFSDSLPDGWGRLLVDRMLRKAGERPEEINPFSRLSIIGMSGMGALEYQPVYDYSAGIWIDDLDRLAEECSKVLQSRESDDLDLLFTMGGSSGGERPKVLLTIDDEEWIIQF